MSHPPLLPPLRRTAVDAEAVARIVHQGQVDKAGRPYIEHVERVASRPVRLAPPGASLAQMDEAVQIAFLHDVLEPDERPFGPLTSDDLLEEGFSARVVEAVAGFLTREPGETYADYIKQLVEEAPLPVLLVKLADLEDNSDPARLALLPPDKVASLSKRYDPAKAAIRSAIGERFGEVG